MALQTTLTLVRQHVASIQYRPLRIESCCCAAVPGEQNNLLGSVWRCHFRDRLVGALGSQATGEGEERQTDCEVPEHFLATSRAQTQARLKGCWNEIEKLMAGWCVMTCYPLQFLRKAPSRHCIVLTDFPKW